MTKFLLNTSRCCLLTVVAIAPWVFGGVELSIARWLYWGVLAGFFCWLGAVGIQWARTKRITVQLPITVVPLLAAIGLGAVQLVPIARIFDLELRDIGRAPRVQPSETGTSSSAPSLRSHASPGSATLSFYPASTRLGTAQLAMAVITFCLGAVLFVDAQARLWLWGVSAMNGAALAFVGIVQAMSPAHGLPWMAGLEEGSPFASFVNRNNAAGFLNLCLACGVGLMLSSALKGSRPRTARESAHRPRAAFAQQRGRPGESSPRSGAPQLSFPQLVKILLLVLTVAGILCSGSRGGTIAMASATLAIFLTLMRKRKAKRVLFVLAGVLVVAVALVHWVGLGGELKNRLYSLVTRGGSGEVRLSNWHDASGTAADFWLSGTGFGTYRYAYLPYQEHLAESWFVHAENQYLEALVEGGIIGLALMLTALALVFLATLRLVRSGDRCTAVAIGCVGLFAVVSQCVHGLVDFGLYIPANTLLFALLCGSASAAPIDSPSAGGTPAVFMPRTTWIVALTVGVLGIMGILGLREVSAAARAWVAGGRLPKLTSPDSLSGQEVDVAIDRMTRSANRRPDDAELRARLADAWIYRYRLQAYEQLQRDAASTRAIDAQENWKLTSIAVLHQRTNVYHQLGDEAAVEHLRGDPIVCRNLKPAVRHLLAAQAACPILPRIDVKLAALSFLLGPGAPDGERHLRRAVRLTPGDPDVLYACGVLADQAQLKGLAYYCWRRSLSLNGRYEDEILARVRTRLSLAEIITRVMPESPQFLVDWARRDFAEAHLRDERALLGASARRLAAARQDKLSPRQRHHLYGVINDLEGNLKESVACYLQALRIDPLQTEWRFELARLLQRQGRIEEANAQAKLCAQLAPDRLDYRRLARELSTATLRRLSKNPETHHPVPMRLRERASFATSHATHDPESREVP